MVKSAQTDAIRSVRPSARGREGPKAERQGQMVRAMLEVVAERGYDGASVAEVARRAGLAPGLVHYYFRDKLALALALVEFLGEVAAEREAARLALAPEGGRALAIVDAYLARGAGAAPAVMACWVALGAEAVRRPEVREAYGRVLSEGASRLGALLCLDGISTPASARRDAAALVAAIQGYFQLSIAAPALVPEGSAAESVRAMLEGLRGASVRVTRGAEMGVHARAGRAGARGGGAEGAAVERASKRAGALGTAPEGGAVGRAAEGVDAEAGGAARGRR